MAGAGSFASVDDLIWLADPDPNAPLDASGNRPLHYAAKHGSVEAITELINLGADPGIENHARQKASVVAKNAGHIDAALLLRSHEKRGVTRPQLPQGSSPQSVREAGEFAPTSVTIDDDPDWTVPDVGAVSNDGPPLQLPQPDTMRPVGGHEICDQSYRQIMRWLERIRSTGRNFTLEDFIERQPENWIHGGRIVEINLSYLGLATLDLTEVPELTTLWCNNNQLTELNLEHVPGLTTLHCEYNNLIYLDLESVPSLTALFCGNNHLSELDLASVPGLAKLWCSGNHIAALDLYRCRKLKKANSVTGRAVTIWRQPSQAPATVQSGRDSKEEKQSSKPKNLRQVGTHEICEQSYNQIVIWLEHLKSIGREIGLDELVSRQAKSWVLDGNIVELNVSFLGFSKLDLAGIPSLNQLWCDNNQLTDLDLSSVPELKVLYCNRNQLTEIQLCSVPELTELWCNDNKLTELDLASVPELTKLSCDSNQLTELDLASIPDLTILSCRSNQLTELDLGNVPELTNLWCGDNYLTELDLAGVPDLNELWCDNNQLAALDLSRVPTLTTLSCDKNQLSELELSSVKALTRLDCDHNMLTQLDLASVPRLTWLSCGNNQLTELDLKCVPDLTTLWSDDI